MSGVRLAGAGLGGLAAAYRYERVALGKPQGGGVRRVLARVRPMMDEEKSRMDRLIVEAAQVRGLPAHVAAAEHCRSEHDAGDLAAELAPEHRRRNRAAARAHQVDGH